MSTKNSRKVLSVLLAYMMVLSSFSGMAVAAEENTGENGAQAVVSSGPAPDADAADTVLTSTPDAKDVEKLLKDLPDAGEVDSDSDLEEIEDLAAEAMEAYEGLSAEEQEEVDPDLVANLYDLVDALSAAQIMPMADTTVSTADELKDAIENGGAVITLAGNIDLTEGTSDGDLTISNEIMLDLAGHTLTVNHLNIEDDGDLILNDSNKTGTITSNDKDYTIQVLAGGTLTINGGTYTNTSTDKNDKGGTNQVETIVNRGTLTVTGGTIEATTGAVYGVGIYIQPTKDDDRTVSCTIKGGKIVSNCYGVAIFGRGDYKNDGVTLDMSGGEIEIVGDNGGQGIATNASNGIYAGFTIDLSGNAKITADVYDGCAMYLPGPGVTTISDSVEIVGKLQGIRIAAGVLNIEGGTIQNSNNRVDNADLVSGGSGGTAGAVVVGKASGGYPDDIIINVTGGKIENVADGDDNDAIVVSDKNMADTNKEGKLNYEQFKIEVNVSNGADVTGNVYTVSNLTSDETEDGGNVSVKLEDVTVEGDIENASKSPVTANDVTVTGNVTAKNKDAEEKGGSISIINSVIEGNASGNVILSGSRVEGVNNTQTVATNKIYNNRTQKEYDSLAEAITDLEDGDTLILGQGYFTADETVTIDKNNITICGYDQDETTIQTAILVKGDNFAIKDLSIDSDVEKTDALKFSQGTDLLTKGAVENVTVKSSKGHALNVHGVKDMTITNFTAEEVGKLSLSISNSENVTVNGFTGTSEGGGWDADIGIMYESDKSWYGNAVNLTLKGKINFAHESPIYSEFTTESVEDSEELDTIIWENADGEKTVLYKVLGDNDDPTDPTSQYHYVTSDKIEASIDDKLAQANPTGYLTLEEAVEDAKNGDTIDLHDDVDKDITINKDNITINANKNQIAGKVTITGENVSIENADLSEANITVDSGSANLSNNYWGGVPEDIPGATIDSYYENEDMTGDIVITNQLNWAENQIKGAQFDNIASKEANTKEAVDELVREKLDEILKGFEGEYTIVDSGFKAAVDGDAEHPNGAEGEYTFSVVLTYVGDSAKVENLTITITPAEYVPEDPDEPEDPDKPTEPEDPDNPKPEDPDDDDDDNSSSSGGSSGGGSFIGHPDGWVPGGIIILDGSEQIQPTGSLLLDTKTYTMAPGVVYDILATLEGASENELRVYSSQPGVASVEAIGGGKYRVTGLADGQTYIMFEVWRNGVMLNHASVKVTIADGVTAYGESNREASIF